MKKYFRNRLAEAYEIIKSISIISSIKPPVKKKNIKLFSISAIAALIVFFLMKDQIPREAALMLFIFIFASLLWVTEALPLFATSLIIIALEVVLIANPGEWKGLGFENNTQIPFAEFFSPLADPIIFLFLGGFLLAKASVKEGVDISFAGKVMKIFGGKPLFILLGLLTITATFSMWMSNTATTAMMITIVSPIIKQIPEERKFHKSLYLAIPIGANIGGMGTPIASPPNAVAIGFLKSQGFSISFIDWMIIALPIVIVLGLVAWLILWNINRPKSKELKILPIKNEIDGRGLYVVSIFSLTIILWLSEPTHGLPAAVIALLPAIAFTATGLLGRKDFNSLEWNILILIAGGIALGKGMTISGLDDIIIDLIPKESIYLFGIFILFSILLSTFMSNTAAANLVIPIGVSLAASLGSEISELQMGMGIALAASLAMALPVSTPPNTIAYASGKLKTKDFIYIGSTMSFIGFVLITIFFPKIIQLLGFN
ncbi:SLC13 family permease [Mangrovivirga cuniculi]|uniref:Sodium:sulfate symporter n=1 Tax=Mangrovivirga cuniculi TaxID=2715131 RepID=A0A4D7K7X3_9BACT|nr:DASS family sodium-coupled anion symporter [Mangrovivirga cuniculi]QCK16834.1 sodium:sulfate symporter [Mangrovivirga cuniculi]